MKKHKIFTSINWSIFTLIYLLFLWWHGAFEGPLTSKEIDFYSKKIHEIAPENELEFMKKILQKDKGYPIYMMNAMKLREKPLARNGNETGNTSEETLRKYGNFVGSFLIRRGSYPIFYGIAEGKAASTWGIENAEEWTSAAVVRYKSIRTLLELAINPEFREMHEFKIAALEKTIAYPTFARIDLGALQLLMFFILLSLALVVQLFITTRWRNKL